MLARKQSISGVGPGVNPQGFAPGDPGADYGPDETMNEGMDVVWTSKELPRKFLRAVSLLSLFSVMLNTPKTFEYYPYLFYVTYAVDWFCVLVFTAEMITKINHMGMISGEKSYLKDRWCQFDASMLFFIVISVILQTFEMLGLVKNKYSPLSVLRSPRPLIMIRFIRVFLKFSMPKGRINQIFKRSGHQIYNVTIFFLFFMSLYGLLGVQFFGELNYHCVREGVKAENVTTNDLTIPDSYCNPKNNSGGHRCPEGFNCIKLSVLGKDKTGFIGFGEFVSSVFTVYTGWYTGLECFTVQKRLLFQLQAKRVGFTSCTGPEMPHNIGKRYCTSPR